MPCLSTGNPLYPWFCSWCRVLPTFLTCVLLYRICICPSVWTSCACDLLPAILQIHLRWDSTTMAWEGQTEFSLLWSIRWERVYTTNACLCRVILTIVRSRWGQGILLCCKCHLHLLHHQSLTKALRIVCHQGWPKHWFTICSRIVHEQLRHAVHARWWDGEWGRCRTLPIRPWHYRFARDTIPRAVWKCMRVCMSQHRPVLERVILPGQ